MAPAEREGVRLACVDRCHQQRDSVQPEVHAIGRHPFEQLEARSGQRPERQAALSVIGLVASAGEAKQPGKHPNKLARLEVQGRLRLE